MMGLGRLKREADALAAEGVRLAAARDRHAQSSLARAGTALSSPAALAIVFAAGFVLGAPRTRPRGTRDDHAAEAGSGDGRIGRWLAGPVGTLALKAAFALLGAAGAPAREVPPAG